VYEFVCVSVHMCEGHFVRTIDSMCECAYMSLCVCEWVNEYE